MTAETAQIVLYCLFFFFLGVAVVLAIAQRLYAKFRAGLQRRSEEVEANAIKAAEVKRGEILVLAKEEAHQIKRDAEQEAAKQLQTHGAKLGQLQLREASLKQQEAVIEKQQGEAAEGQKHLAERLAQADELKADLVRLQEERTRALEVASEMSQQEAASQLMDSLKEGLKSEVAAVLAKHRKSLSAEVDRQSREMLLTAIQRYSSAHTAESTTSTVDVPTDDMKGRIIGREGRNIRAFEKITGVDLIIDDTPGVVIVSGFDPVRREIARQALDKLIADGRIHPAKIEEVVAEKASQINEFIRLKGQEAAEEVNVSGLHERVVEMLGRLHFRTSYSQNVLRHSIEVAFISGMLAEMLGMKGDVARRAGLLHDIGKAADHELEGGHPKIGGDLLARSGEGQEVVHAARGHHDEVITEFPYTMLVASADACSASRPGARRESLERYVKRMEELETIAMRFDGVQQAFAVSAGRELRVLINSEKSDDADAAIICRDIAKAFEEELTYPGEIKVTVIRESHFTEIAR
ncbi:MAG: ribonuclease Y [Planctomycetota bacterium]